MIVWIGLFTTVQDILKIMITCFNNFIVANACCFLKSLSQGGRLGFNISVCFKYLFLLYILICFHNTGVYDVQNGILFK